MQAAAEDSGVLNLGEAGDTSVAPKSGLSSQEERELTKQLNALERKVSKLDQKIGKFNVEMATAAEKLDTAKLTELDNALKQAQEEREELEVEWLEIGEQLENG